MSFGDSPVQSSLPQVLSQPHRPQPKCSPSARLKILQEGDRLTVSLRTFIFHLDPRTGIWLFWWLQDPAKGLLVFRENWTAQVEAAATLKPSIIPALELT